MGIILQTENSFKLYFTFTAVARAVQHEASITLTVEAAWGVLAVSMGATNHSSLSIEDREQAGLLCGYRMDMKGCHVSVDTA